MRFYSFNKKRANSKKRALGKPKASRRRSSRGDTLTVEFPDGSIKVVKPDMNQFDGDWASLALSLCEGHRVSWRIS